MVRHLSFHIRSFHWPKYIFCCFQKMTEVNNLFYIRANHLVWGVAQSMNDKSVSINGEHFSVRLHLVDDRFGSPRREHRKSPAGVTQLTMRACVPHRGSLWPAAYQLRYLPSEYKHIWFAYFQVYFCKNETSVISTIWIPSHCNSL